MSTGVQGLEGQKRLDVVRGSACRGEGLGRSSKVAILRQGDDTAGVVLRLAPGWLGAALAGDFLLFLLSAFFSDFIFAESDLPFNKKTGRI